MIPRSMLSLVLVTLGAACGGAVDLSSADGGATDGAANDTGGDGATTCVDLPTLTSSDLACIADEDCASVWSGTVCSCGCACPFAPANTAARARAQATLSSLASESPCRGHGCFCPTAGTPRCFAHQCALCGFGPNQPAGCSVDAGAHGG